MFLSHLVTEICQKEDFQNYVAAILDLCKLDHVPPIIFSYTFLSVILDIFLKQIALESFLLQLVVGLSVL
jgi:hypothetical protein